jgi:hypothetical protein
MRGVWPRHAGANGMQSPLATSLSARRGGEHARNHWNALLRPRGHRGGVGGHGPGHRARRHRGVDDHARNVKGCTNYERFQNQRLKAAAAAEVTAGACRSRVSARIAHLLANLQDCEQSAISFAPMTWGSHANGIFVVVCRWVKQDAKCWPRASVDRIALLCVVAGRPEASTNPLNALTYTTPGRPGAVMVVTCTRPTAVPARFRASI